MNAPPSPRGAPLLSRGKALAIAPNWLARLAAGWLQRLLDGIDRGLETGLVTGILPDGTIRVLGGRVPGFTAQVHLVSARALLRLATGGSVGWYQAWAAGEWTSPDPVQVFALFTANAVSLGNAARATGPWRWLARLAHLGRRNTRAGARRNIHAHYDLGNDFYASWLGHTMLYSSARFADAAEPGDGQQQSERLDQAQIEKLRSICRRLGIAGGDRVLEIGCGWGALSLFVAGTPARVDAISISDSQIAFCREQAGRLSPGGEIDFRKQDYRDVHGRYDAIACVEMVEALGRENWGPFMDCVARNLRPGGRAALQFITIAEPLFAAYAGGADFIQTYVFPGGMLIREAEFRALAQARGLAWTEPEAFGADYAETLRLWRERFDRAVDEGRLPIGFDQRFVALWRYYLMYCEGGFRGGAIDVMQVTLVKHA